LTKKAPLIITWIATLAGILDAGYLSYQKLTQSPVYCTPGIGNCNAVDSSSYSVLFGIPVAYLGLFMYLVVLFLLVFGESIKPLKPYALYLMFGLSFFSFLFSLYLTYLEIWVIKTICEWCIISAFLVTVIFISTSIRLFNRQKTNPT
jgi:uncharacterized membrane protein